MKHIDTIQAATIARVTSKESGKLLGFLVKSNSSDAYYQVRCTRLAGDVIWTCTCKAGQFGFAGCSTGHCCHVQAVLEVAEARKALAYKKMGKEFQVGQEQVTSRRDSQGKRFFTCTCSDFTKHNVECEHIQAVYAQAAEQRKTAETTVTVTQSPAHQAMIDAAEKKAAVPAKRTRKSSAKTTSAKRAPQFADFVRPADAGTPCPQF